MEFGLNEVPQEKYESLIEMRTDANNDYLEKEEIKEIIEELVLSAD